MQVQDDRTLREKIQAETTWSIEDRHATKMICRAVLTAIDGARSAYEDGRGGDDICEAFHRHADTLARVKTINRPTMRGILGSLVAKTREHVWSLAAVADDPENRDEGSESRACALRAVIVEHVAVLSVYYT